MAKPQCVRCNKEDIDELRPLRMHCLYNMDEIELPFIREKLYTNEYMDYEIFNFYILIVCKRCRAEWLRAIQSWFFNIEPDISCGSGIFIRDFGHNKEITYDEFKRRYPDREPVRCLPNVVE